MIEASLTVYVTGETEEETQEKVEFLYELLGGHDFISFVGMDSAMNKVKRREDN